MGDECSGLIPQDTLIGDNNNPILRCHYECKESLQTILERI